MSTVAVRIITKRRAVDDDFTHWRAADDAAAVKTGENMTSLNCEFTLDRLRHPWKVRLLCVGAVLGKLLELGRG